MAALVQTYTAQQPSASVSLMQSRSQSSGTIHTPNPHNNSSTRYRDALTGGSGGYRAGYTSGPVAPYAFTSTPGLAGSKNSQKAADRPAAVQANESRQTYTSLESISLDSSLKPPRSQSPNVQPVEDGASQQSTRSGVRTASPSTLQPPPSVLSPAKPSPDRYRRVNRRPESVVLQQSAPPSGSGMAAISAVYANPGRANSTPSIPQHSAQLGQSVVKAPFIGDYAGQLRGQSVDDIHTHKTPSSQHSPQSRRRSVGPGSITAESFQTFVRQELAAHQGHPSPRPASPSGGQPGQDFKPPVRPGSRRTGSTDSSASGGSSKASTSSKRNSVASNSSSPANGSSGLPVPGSHEINLAHVPPRGSSTDGNKRTAAPSPLSNPVTMSSDPTQSVQGVAVPSGPAKSSPATDQLAALNEGQKKGMKNRLRRAFSFGSAAELRKASVANNLRGEAERVRLRQEKLRDEQEAEHERIARQQEASGLGESIYSGQGNFFSGSTDNISVSSTASSASVIMRKMGKGIKRSSRSLVGLFRPKSMVGAPAATGPIAGEPSMGAVSMVTIEAEREKVNVNARPSESHGAAGGTDFPKLERNSLDMARDNVRRGSVGSDSRRSIVGGDKERAEVLAAVKKGILKRSGSSSPVVAPSDREQVPIGFQLPEIPSVSGPENQRPASKQGATAQKPEGTDYFVPAPRFPNQSHSAPTSPSSMTKYSVSFSPRITFHDTWPSGEYDRRGDVATCNRLTPLLAQQIKEELNTFKMEMEVHEESKVYTHFF